MRKFLSIIMLLIFILSNVNSAVFTDTSHPFFVEVSSVELRSDYDSYWSNSINVNDNDAVDIRAELFLDYYNYYGDYYYNDWIQAYAEIYGYNNGWVYLKTTNTRNISLNYLNYKTVYWYDAFFIDDYYSKYKVIVYAENSTDYYNSGSNIAFVDLVNSGFDSYCDDIEIFSNSVAMNENETEFVTFNIKNNSNERFYIKGVSPVEYESFFGVFTNSNDSSIASDGLGQVRLKVNSSEVNSDRTGTATLKIKGEFASGKTCSYSDIKKDFIVRVSDNSFDNSCGNISISASNERIQENDSETFSFTVRNYSDSAFYIDDFDVLDNSSYFNATESYNPSLIPKNSSREFDYKINSNSVSFNETGKIYIRISGHYSGGNYCSYSEIREETVNITVENSYFNEGECNDIYLNTKNLNLNENDYFSASFSVENNSNERFYIEGIDFDEFTSFAEFRNIDFPSYINNNSEKNVSFSVKTDNVSSDKTSTAYFKVKGKFENGETCSFSDTRKSFNLKVNNSDYYNNNTGNEDEEEQETTDNCSDFSLEVPSIKSVLGKEKITLKINNPLSKTGTIKINGTNLSVSPYSINIPKNYSFTKTIEVELLEGKENYLVYDVSLTECNVQSKTTKIISSEQAFEVTDFPSKKIVSLDDSISFTLINNSSSSKEFRVFMEDLGLLKANEKSIVIPANSNRTISIEIKAENSGKYNAVLVVESAGKRIEKAIELIVEEKEIKISAETTKKVFNETELKITIENETAEGINGNLIVEIPEEWTLEGNTKVEVKAGETKEVFFKLKTNGTEKEIPVSFVLDNGKEINTKSETKEIGAATALISLGQNAAVTIGLLAIIIIIVVMLVKKQ